MINIAKTAIDLTGMRFGRLLVNEMVYIDKNGRRSLYCKCKCDCGNDVIANAYNIKKGATKSCGCLETESRYVRKHSKFNPQEVYEGFTLVCETDKRAQNGSIIWQCKCNKCGEIVEIAPSNIIKNKMESCGCDYVHPLLKDLTGRRFGLLTAESVVKRKRRKDPNYRRVMWNCICDCGSRIVASSDMLVSLRTTSCGCRVNKSAMVFAIKRYLMQHDIEFIEEYRFKDCRDIKPLPFDFYLPQINTIIEYDGKQHYEAVNFWGGEEHFRKMQLHDKIKNDYCYEHNIRLIRLPYYLNEEKIIEILEELEPVTSKCSA